MSCPSFTKLGMRALVQPSKVNSSVVYWSCCGQSPGAWHETSGLHFSTAIFPSRQINIQSYVLSVSVLARKVHLMCWPSCGSRSQRSNNITSLQRFDALTLLPMVMLISIKTASDSKQFAYTGISLTAWLVNDILLEHFMVYNVMCQKEAGVNIHRLTWLPVGFRSQSKGQINRFCWVSSWGFS